MSLSDTAEYWWDVKGYNRKPYSGRNFKHIPNSTCGHIKPHTGNTATTPYIGDINCFACIELLKNGHTRLGLIEGNAPPTYYMSIKEKKRYNKQQAFNIQHGLCECGSIMCIRQNKTTKEEFLGCIRYPLCKKTKSIKK